MLDLIGLAVAFGVGVAVGRYPQLIAKLRAWLASKDAS